MPAVTQDFLNAVNGCTRDDNIGCLITTPASGARNLWAVMVNEKFCTTGDPNGYIFTPLAFQILSAAGAVPAPLGAGVSVGGVVYSVTTNDIVTPHQIDVQQVTP